MIHLLIDTCVWLDLAKDHQQQTILAALEELVARHEVKLILPRIVLDEFKRNKARIIEESGRSLSSTIRRVKDAVRQFGELLRREMVLDHLADVDHRLPIVGDTASLSVSRIENLFASSEIIEATPDVKCLAAERALEHRAPCHRQRNSIADAVLIEIYAAVIKQKKPGRARFGFVSHNIRDFSLPDGNSKIPHPDIAACFSKTKSLYLTFLGEALRRARPGAYANLVIESEWVGQPRHLSDILAAIEELTDKIWYDRHMVRKESIESGAIALVDEIDLGKGYQPDLIRKDVWHGAGKAAALCEKKYGRKALGPWTKFEWGMMNGKLSALNWVIGEDWDMLDT